MSHSPQASDAYLFPVIGGVVLTTLYFAFKYLSKAWINYLLGAYFALAGVGALAKVSRMINQCCGGWLAGACGNADRHGRACRSEWRWCEAR